MLWVEQCTLIMLEFPIGNQADIYIYSLAAFSLAPYLTTECLAFVAMSTHRRASRHTVWVYNFMYLQESF